jgi:hypothetical protein
MSSCRPTVSSPRSRRCAERLVSGFAIALSIAACSHHNGGAPPDASPADTELVVGITADDSNGALGSIHVVTSIDGTGATDEVVTVLNNPSALPKEVRLTAPTSNPSAHVNVQVDGYLDPTWDTTKSTEHPIVTRTAETTFVPGQTSLLRVHIDQSCLTGVPGSTSIVPTCAQPQTCIMGSCADDTVPSVNLEPYSPDWDAAPPDICKPANAGPPVVQVGEGQTDYLPLTDGQDVQAQTGPQGGHHVWVAIRMHNLRQVGSTTTITGTQSTTGISVPATSYVFVFDQDEGGYCKLYGLRYQLDSGGTDYHQFLGQPLDLKVVVQDSTGAVGTGMVSINIDPLVLCPNGTAARDCAP